MVSSRCTYLNQRTGSNCAIWGRVWQAHTIHILSDNTAAIAAINNSTSVLEESVYLLCCLAFETDQHQYKLVASHTPGQHNVLVDALSSSRIIPHPTSTGTSNPPGSANETINHGAPGLDITALDSYPESGLMIRT